MHKKTYCTGYVDDLLDLIFDEVFVLPAPYVEEVLNIPIPPPLSAEDFSTSKVSLYNLEAVWNLYSCPVHLESPDVPSGPHRLGWNYTMYLVSKETSAPAHKTAIGQKSKE